MAEVLAGTEAVGEQPKESVGENQGYRKPAKPVETITANNED